MIGLGRLVTIAGAFAVVLAVSLGGLYAAGVVGIPDAGLEDNAWGEVDDERIEVVTTVWIDNPNPGLALDDAEIEYTMAMNDVALAEGTHSDVAVPSGNETTTVRTDLYYERLPAWWATHMENDETSELAVEAQVHADVGPVSGSPTVTHDDEIETDLEALIEDSLAEMEGDHHLSPVDPNLDLDLEGADAIEPTVVVTETDAEWGTVHEDRTELHMTFHVHNPNPYPIATPALTGGLAFNDRTVAEWDAHEVELLNAAYDTTIPPGATRELTFVADVDNDDAVAWFATHVDNEELSEAEMTAQLAMDVGGHTVTVPVEEEAMRCEYDMTTAIFVDQEAGIANQSCELVPWATPDGDELRELGASIDLTDDDLLEDALTDPFEEDDAGSDTDDDSSESDDGDDTADDGGDDDTADDDDGLLEDPLAIR